MKKVKILIADDEELIHHFYTDCLKDQFEVIHAYDGADTLISAVEQLPEIILLDINMPIVDGRTICQRLKKNHRTECIKIIMLTGKDDEFNRRVAFELGADEFIAKPCSSQFLDRIIKKISIIEKNKI